MAGRDNRADEMAGQVTAAQAVDWGKADRCERPGASMEAALRQACWRGPSHVGRTSDAVTERTSNAPANRTTALRNPVSAGRAASWLRTGSCFGCGPGRSWAADRIIPGLRTVPSRVPRMSTGLAGDMLQAWPTDATATRVTSWRWAARRQRPSRLPGVCPAFRARRARVTRTHELAQPTSQRRRTHRRDESPLSARVRGLFHRFDRYRIPSLALKDRRRTGLT